MLAKLLNSAKAGEILEILNILKKQDLELINTPCEKSNKTALYFAIERKHYLLAECLIILGANKLHVTNLAESLNDIETIADLKTLTFNIALIRVLLMWSIKNELPTLMTSIISYARQELRLLAQPQTNDDLEERKSDDSAAASIVPDLENFEIELQGFLELAIYLQNVMCVQPLLDLEVKVREYYRSYTAGFWAAFASNKLLDFYRTLPDHHQGLSLAQLEAEKKFELLGNMLRHSSESAIENYKQLDIKKVTAELIEGARIASELKSKLQYHSADPVRIYKNLSENEALPNIKSLIYSLQIKFNSEYFYNYFLNCSSTYQMLMLPFDINLTPVVIALTAPDIKKRNFDKIEFEPSPRYIYNHKNFYIYDKEKKFCERLTLLQNLDEKLVNWFKRQLVMPKGKQFISKTLTKNDLAEFMILTFKVFPTAEHKLLNNFYHAFITQFPGYYSHVLYKTIEKNVYYLPELDSNLISLSPLRDSQKKQLIELCFEDKYNKKEPSNTMEKSAFSFINKMMGFTTAENYQPNKLSQILCVLPNIIDMLDADGQQSFAASGRENLALVNDPNHRQKRLLLRKIGQLNKKKYLQNYKNEQEKKWCQLAKQFTKQMDEDINGKGFFSHRFRTAYKDCDLFILISLLVLLGLLAWDIPFFNSAQNQKDTLDANAEAISFDCIEYKPNSCPPTQPNTRNCYSYAEIAPMDFGCLKEKLYQNATTTANAHGLVWPMITACAELCQQYDDLAPAWQAGITITIVSSVLIFTLTTIGCCFYNTFNIRGKERFETLDISILSETAQQQIREIIALENEITNNSFPNGVPENFAIKDVKAYVNNKRDRFSKHELSLQANNNDEIEIDINDDNNLQQPLLAP